MFYEIGEHIGRDLRAFLHTESFQVLHIRCLRSWTALFNSNRRFLIGLKIELFGHPHKWCVLHQKKYANAENNPIPTVKYGGGSTFFGLFCYHWS
jgi:hypothetical protein